MSKQILLSSVICVVLFLSCVNCVSQHGEKCNYTAECTDHRLVCQSLSENNSTKICQCDRFHQWKGAESGCVQNYSVENILELLQQKYNIEEHIQREADLIFYAQIFAGLFVMCVGLSCSLIILIYCRHIRSKDQKLKEIVAHLKSIQDERVKLQQKSKREQRLTEIT